jgi:hypothetical protein
MSALGQKLPRRDQSGVSVLPPKAAAAVAVVAAAKGQKWPHAPQHECVKKDRQLRRSLRNPIRCFVL